MKLKSEFLQFSFYNNYFKDYLQLKTIKLILDWIISEDQMFKFTLVINWTTNGVFNFSKILYQIDKQ